MSGWWLLVAFVLGFVVKGMMPDHLWQRLWFGFVIGKLMREDEEQ